jgi:hypothetical protein
VKEIMKWKPYIIEHLLLRDLKYFTDFLWSTVIHKDGINLELHFYSYSHITGENNEAKRNISKIIRRIYNHLNFRARRVED